MLSLSLIRGSVESSAISKRRQKINGAENQRKSSPTTAHTHAALGLKFRFRSKSAHRLSEPFTLWALIIIRFLGVGARRALYLSFERKKSPSVAETRNNLALCTRRCERARKKGAINCAWLNFFDAITKMCGGERAAFVCVCVHVVQLHHDPPLDFLIRQPLSTQKSLKIYSKKNNHGAEKTSNDN